ncbi:hypothetical protein PENSPDRAFT_683880 [Peniophora sp. CONT]|nr:hypothetical protein PENSPDRAFT_683880 [Peniophora sp. CONT]
MDYTAHLPTETLCLIFCFSRITNNIPIFAQERHSAARSLAWINLTHVCARWRKVALEDASLWTNIPTDLGGQWTETFLSRSKQLPITVHSTNAYNPRPSVQKRLEATISAHHTRIRTFTSLNIECNSVLFQLLCRPWPVLEDLEVTFSGEFHSSTFILFDNHAPCLRSMFLYLAGTNISSSRFDWNMSILDNLVDLIIVFLEGIETASMNDFVNALTRMSRLTNLHIVGLDKGLPTFDSCAACLTSRRQPVPLLKILHMNTSIPMASHIMKHVLPPPDGSVVFEVNHMQKNNDGDEALHGVLAQVAEWNKELPPDSPYAAVVFEVDDESHTCVRMSRTLRFAHSSAARRKRSTHSGLIHPNLSITLSDKFFDVWSALFSNAVRTLAPHGIRALSLELDVAEMNIDPDLGLSHTSYTNVAILRLRCLSTKLLRLLVDQRDDGVFIFFPALKILDISECELADLLHRRSDDEGTLWSAFLRMLECRRKQSPLQATYLRVAGEISQEMKAVPEVQFIRREEDVDYSAYIS